jgi:hypothetical protein
MQVVESVDQGTELVELVELVEEALVAQVLEDLLVMA